MISYGVYRLVHFFGIFLLLSALGGAVAAALAGTWAGAAGTDVADGGSSARRLGKLIAISHGIALFLILLGGFGMLARLDIGFPNWIVGKLVVWLILGGLLTAAKKLGAGARLLWFAIPVLGLLAGWLAYTKPI